MKIALLIEYDGSDFAGWQIQPEIRTVQGDLEAALAKLFSQPITLYGCGRTDAGVHAKGLVAHASVTTSEALPLWKIVEALNALTEQDIVIRDIREVPEDFHARFSATERTYRYRISRKRIAIERGYYWQVLRPLDLDLLQELASSILGNHDFTSFSKQTEDIEHFRSIITRSEIRISEDEIEFWISANRFVRGMVRALTGALIEAAKGKLEKEEFLRLLDTPTHHNRARFLAPAEGLTFWDVKYSSEYNLW